MNIIYTIHAKQRMRQRGVTQRDIRNAFVKPIFELLRKDGTMMLQHKTRKGMLEIIYNKSHTACVIITCYYI